jgi:hypothetical protein
VSANIKLVTLILSFDSGSFREIQEKGQNGTFIQEASTNSKVLRYVGKNVDLPQRYRLISQFRRLQYALLDYSSNFLVAHFLRVATNLRIGDGATSNLLGSTKSQTMRTKEVSQGAFGGKIIINLPEDWSLIGLKTIEAFKHILRNYEFDFIFRTNTSSYLDVPRLLKYLDKQSKDNVYAGVIGSALGDLKFASGAGILLSRDVVERICKNENQWKHGLVDDVALAELVLGLIKPNVTLQSLPRLEIPSLDVAKSTDATTIRESFHIRCKSSSSKETIEIMKYIYSVKQLRA